MNVKKLKQANIGITLIALVVTIVILLILAGITINLVFSDNGIIKKAQIAKNEVEVSTIKEAISIYDEDFKKLSKRDKESILYFIKFFLSR